MPWRRTKDPYAIWVSEVMLQQTQVSVVIPYYERWMKHFPSVGSLATASEEEVLQLWQGLGYYRRAKSLLVGARYVIEHGFPEDVVGWKRVPGVGNYTAGAIVSIALGQPVALVDGNVERVFARLTGDKSSGAEVSKKAWQWAEENVCQESPGNWNQALMELGATVCTPKNPNCSTCPVRLECRAFLRGLTNELPVAAPKAEVKRIKQTFWVLLVGDQVHLRQSDPGEWWAGMYVLPASEEPPVSGWVEDLGRFTFAVTNHRISAAIKLIRLEAPAENLPLYDLRTLGSIPIPAPHRKALNLLQRI